mgnify:CR=1 FL=1
MFLHTELILDGAIYGYSSYFGDGGLGFLSDTWIFGVDDTFVYATFNRQTCAPVMKVVYGANPGKFYLKKKYQYCLFEFYFYCRRSNNFSNK